MPHAVPRHPRPTYHPAYRVCRGYRPAAGEPVRAWILFGRQSVHRTIPPFRYCGRPWAVPVNGALVAPWLAAHGQTYVGLAATIGYSERHLRRLSAGAIRFVDVETARRLADALALPLAQLIGPYQPTIQYRRILRSCSHCGYRYASRSTRLAVTCPRCRTRPKTLRRAPQRPPTPWPVTALARAVGQSRAIGTVVARTL